MPRERDALITGVGLVSSLGEGLDAHWAALTAPGGFRPVVDSERFARLFTERLTKAPDRRP